MVVDGWLTGEHAGRRRGFASDFSEHRDYVPGDDLRHLDWKAYARRDRFYVRQFEEEARICINIILDTSDSMRYQSDDAVFSKLKYGAIVAAALGWVALSQGDDVQLILLRGNLTGEHESHGMPFSKFDFRPGAGDQERLIHCLEREIASESRTEMSGIEETQSGVWTSLLGPRCPSFWLTDAFMELDDFKTTVLQCRHQQADLRVAQVLDHAEIEFPFTGNIDFHDLEGPGSSVVPTDALRETYRESFEEFLRELQGISRASGVPIELIETHQAVDDFLQRFLATRV